MTLIHRIKRLFDSFPDPTEEQLACGLRKLRITRKEVLPFILEPAEFPYGRNTIFQSDNVEVVVIHLPANTSSSAHDHGYSYGCEIVLEGQLVNRVYSFDEQRELQIVKEERFPPGSICRIHKGDVHSINNEREERLITLNVYAPPIRDATSYKVAEEIKIEEADLYKKNAARPKTATI